MKVLITGGTGLLGRALSETSRGKEMGAVYLGAYHMQGEEHVAYHKADICDKDAMRAIFHKTEPRVVIHTAGIANVDHCERNYEKAWESNVLGTQFVAELCKEYGAKAVFISTNAVFDGSSAPYSEDAVPSPINKYGKMKLDGERIIRESGLEYLIVRPILMYGWNNKCERTNMVTWLIEKLQEEEKVNIVNDVYENPLLNTSCAEIIWSLIDSNKEGVYHLAGKDIVNRYQFARMVADVFELDQKLINGVSSDFFPGLAPRPRNTSYNTAKVEKGLGIVPLGLREGLLRMKQSKIRKG